MSWTAATLKDVVTTSGIQTGPFGSQLHAHDYTPTGVGVVMPQDLGDNVIVLDDMARIDPSRAKSLQRHRLVPGDIVFSRRGDVTKRSLIRNRDGDLICGTGCLRVRIDRDRANPAFIAAFLALPKTKEWLVRHAVGATMPNLNTAILGAVPLRVPELATQDAIAEVLGALDDKIAANQLVIRSILDLGQALVMGTDMTRIPIGQIMTITMGTSPKGDDLNEMTSGVPFFQGVRDFGQIFPKNRIYTTHSIRNAKANDILFAVRAPVGRVNLAVDDVSIGRGIAALTCSTAPATLFYALMAQEQLWQIFDGGGTVFASVNRKEIEAMTIRWPKDTPAIETVVKPLLDRSVLAEQENTTLTAVRDELLPQLMSGRITVKDAEKRVQEEV